MKKVLTGLSNNIAANKQKIKVWSESFKAHCDGDVVLIGANMTEQDEQVCNELNLKFIKTNISNTWYINNDRLSSTRDFIRDSDYDLYIATDVFDVAFQADPFAQLDVENYDLFIGAEGVLVSQEPWNSGVIHNVFPEDFQLSIPTQVLCSGVIAGKKEAMVDLYTKMWDKCQSGVNLDKCNIIDQAALICLVARGEIQKLKIMELSDAWAVHCAVAGPTTIFEMWGFNRIIGEKYGLPYLENSKLYTSDGRLFSIAHQFNRIANWNEEITKAYE